MQDPPSVAQISALVQQTDNLQKRSKFEERVIAAAQELIGRAETLAATSDAVERERLVALLNEEGELGDLNRKLCQRIQDGALDTSDPAVISHLRATTMEKLAIDQPTYAAYQRALMRTEGQ